jgi:hypothetical protein
MDVSQFVYPVTHLWTFVFLYSCYEHLCTSLCIDIGFLFFLVVYLKVDWMDHMIGVY